MAYPFSEALAGLTGTATRDIFRLLSRPEIISFAGGLPANDCLPVAAVAEITAELLADGAEARRILQYGTTEGYPGLRELLAPLLADAGITGLGPDNLLIVSGGGQGLDLMCKAFLNAHDAVLVEDPAFLGFLDTARAYNGRNIGVRAEADGIDLDDLEAKIKRYAPKLLYCVPTFSNPSGKTWPAEKRKAVARLAAEYGVMVIEDDPYARLRFAGTPVPSIKSFDEAGRVVYISSFSKTVSPGLRVGFAAGDAEVIRKLAIGKQGADLHTPNLSMAIVKRYLEKQYFYPNIEKSLPVYRERKNAMVDALDRYWPEEFRRTDPDGGLFIWGEFPPHVDTAALFPEAIARNAAYIIGSVFFAEGADGQKRGSNTLRLNYSNETPERIERGIKVLGELFREKLASSP
ncbi:MAG: PLP-dependent aminotransferase family protein [Spirochaetaceae bacterium]|jgi:2-aminoadipate transaminase|nr:PLP-dependent aminotransferase family protein [Spirochaetaceae bacterium]